jgi:hypothetical protein
LFFRKVTIKREIKKLTKLEIGMIRAYMVATTEHTLHHECSTHGIEQSIVLWNPVVL